MDARVSSRIAEIFSMAGKVEEPVVSMSVELSEGNVAFAAFYGYVSFLWFLSFFHGYPPIFLGNLQPGLLEINMNWLVTL